jgi:hypothetical protein
LTDFYEENKTKLFYSLASLSAKIDELVAAGVTADNEILNLKKIEKEKKEDTKKFN